MTNDSSSMHTKSSASASTRSRNKPRRRKRLSYYYIAFRILFSCGLAALALYWPASKRKPPLGYLPNLRESQNQNQGDRSVSHDNNESSRGDDTQPNPTIAPAIVARAFLPHRLTKETSPTPPASAFIRSKKSKRQRSSYDDDDGALIEDKTSSEKLESAASGHYGHSGAAGTGPGGRIPPNVRPGGPGSGGYGSHWCSLEEAFGDNQSAVVYCQVKDVRPIMTYVWASLILLELCVAYCAGDFAIAGTRRQKGRSYLVAVDDDNHDLEGRSVAAVAVTASENHSGVEVQEQQPPWTTVEQDLVQSQGQAHRLGHSGISITVTEAGAEGAGVGYSGSMDQGHILHGRTVPQIDQ
ncbi:hypothetical protein BGZ75_004724 [Mortierella antarctica]|nr:hypothetical protein BGZ75_004724 [Mortierella antarctica]